MTDPPLPNEPTPVDVADRVEAVPFIHRLQTRLALLILVVVAVLAAATAIQLTRAFEQARVGVVQHGQPQAGGAAAGSGASTPGGSGSAAGGTAAPGTAAAPGATSAAATASATGAASPPGPLDLRDIVRSTLINLAAVFLFTLVGATVFSRRLLTEPIAQLVEGTRELGAGRLGVTLPVTSKSELGLLADAFNTMSGALGQRTRELVDTNRALSVSEARYQLAIEGANDGIWDWDVAAGHMYFSARWASLLGRDDAALEPAVDTWLALAHPDDRAALQGGLEALVNGSAATFQLEHRLRHADGRWLWVLARGAALRRADGRTVRVAGSTTDITERVEALSLLERRVRERTADLSALLELSNSTALTLELGPMLAQILERLQTALGSSGATVYESLPDGAFRRVAGRGAEPELDPALLTRALQERRAQPEAVGASPPAGGPATGQAGTPADVPGTGAAAPAAPRPTLAVPLVVRDAVVGVLLLRRPAGGDDGDRRRLAAAFANQLGVALENARLYQRVQERAALEERQHLARELHDSVSQALYAILLGTHTAQRKLEASPEAARQALDYVEGLAQAGIKEMRALIFVLRPESLENEGLVGVLRKQLDVLETRHGLDATLDAPAEPDASFATKQALYRIAQEALHNVVKHAHAHAVHVGLACLPGHVRLRIRDDGSGFDPHGSYPDHLGLRSMQERARQIPGSLRIESAPGEGTTVTVEAALDGGAGDGSSDSNNSNNSNDSNHSTDPGPTRDEGPDAAA